MSSDFASGYLQAKYINNKNTSGEFLAMLVRKNLGVASGISDTLSHVLILLNISFSLLLYSSLIFCFVLSEDDNILIFCIDMLPEIFLLLFSSKVKARRNTNIANFSGDIYSKAIASLISLISGQ